MKALAENDGCLLSREKAALAYPRVGKGEIKASQAADHRSDLNKGTPINDGFPFKKEALPRTYVSLMTNQSHALSNFILRAPRSNCFEATSKMLRLRILLDHL